MSATDVIQFTEVLKALLDPDKPLPARFLRRLSDLEGLEFEVLKENWPKIPIWRRQALLQDIEDLCKDDTLVSYESLGIIATGDSDALVRLHAVKTLWEFENKNLIPTFKNLLLNDSDVEVRASSATALGQYVYLGELDELPAKKLKEIEDLLLATTNGVDEPQVRQSALESLGYSSREEVPALIEEAFNSEDQEWRASALFAMGRSGDDTWKERVLEMLEDHHPELRQEAARAAGELEIKQAVPLLLELLDDPAEPIRLASIWSLSQIGGEGVREKLEELYDETEDEQEVEYLEAALDNLTFTEGMQLMPILDLSEFEEKDDLEDSDEDELSLLDEYEEDSDD